MVEVVVVVVVVGGGVEVVVEGVVLGRGAWSSWRDSTVVSSNSQMKYKYFWQSKPCGVLPKKVPTKLDRVLPGFFFYRVLRGILRYLKGVASVGFVVGQAEALAGVVGGVLVALVGADPRIDADGLQRADLARPHPNEARIQTARPVVTA